MALFVGGSVPVLFVKVLVCLAVVQTVRSTNMKYKIRANCKIQDEYSMEECTADSLMNCVTKCTTRSGCLSVAWNLHTAVCMLSEYDTIFEVEFDAYMYSGVRGYEEAADWTCASLVRFPVFRALDSTYAAHRYEMLFPRASARCAEMGTILADPSNLTTAQNMGLHYCNCGWMSDGTNALIVDYYASTCFHTYHAGPIRCNFPTADAWCLMP